MNYFYPGRNTVEERLWNELEQAEEVTDLDLEPFIDSVDVDPGLPENVRAVTRHEEYTLPFSDYSLYTNTEIAVSPDFFYFDEKERRHDMIHEGTHALERNDQLFQQLQDRRGVSEEFVEKAEPLIEYRKTNEGLTEAITRELEPSDSGRNVYPYETAEVRNLLESEGLNVSEELSAGEIAERSGELLEGIEQIYGDVYNVDPGLYTEQVYSGTPYRKAVY